MTMQQLDRLYWTTKAIWTTMAINGTQLSYSICWVSTALEAFSTPKSPVVVVLLELDARDDTALKEKSPRCM